MNVPRTARFSLVFVTTLAVVIVAAFAAWQTANNAEAGAPTLVVNSSEDPGDGDCFNGDCSLRDVLLLNLSPGTVIAFNITGGCPCTIDLASSLPFVSESDITIDATTQAEFDGAPVVKLLGTGLPFGNDGITADGNNFVLKGLEIEGFPDKGLEASDVTRLLLRVEDSAFVQNGTGISAAVGGVGSILQVHDSLIFDNGEGANLSNTSTASVAITGSIFDSNSGNGVTVAALESLSFMDNVVTENGNEGAALSNTTTDFVTATGNTFNDNTAAGVEIAASFNLTFNDNTVSRNGGGGGAVLNNTSSDVVEANGNTFNDNDAIGVRIAATDSLDFHDNMVNGNGATGAELNNTSSDIVEITGSTFSGNAGDGVMVAAVDSLVFTDNTVSGNGGGASLNNTSTHVATLEGNTFSDNGSDGVRVGAIDSLTFEGNQVESNMGNGLNSALTTTAASSIRGNTFFDNDASGIAIFAGGHVAEFNRIAANGTGISHTGGGTVLAENNWWGCNEGPEDFQCNGYSGSVDFDPWLVLDVDVLSDSIPVNDATSIVGTVTMNSDEEETFGAGSIPDGTEVLFLTDLGSVGSQQVTKELENGIANATYTADGGPGTATIVMQLDNELTTGDTITVTDAPVTQTPNATVTSTPTLAPTETPGPTPTTTPGPKGLFGDMDCDGDVDAVDALAILRFVAGLPPLAQTEPCDDVGSTGGAFGDVDCDGDVDAVDALKILRHVASLPVSQTKPCQDIGA